MLTSPVLGLLGHSVLIGGCYRKYSMPNTQYSMWTCFVILHTSTATQSNSFPHIPRYKITLLFFFLMGIYFLQTNKLIRKVCVNCKILWALRTVQTSDVSRIYFSFIYLFIFVGSDLNFDNVLSLVKSIGLSCK